jgi:8-amino-7-oxononanoate synthase
VPRAGSDPSSQLSALRAAGLDRRRRVVEGHANGARQRIDGHDVLVFCSNDYLGLAQDPRVAEAFAQAARAYGTGSGASHLVTGHHREHHALEEALADFTGRERALLFSTGYMANLGVVCALAGRGDAVLEDRLNHASLLDAGLLSGARFSRFPHADVAGLERRLAHAGKERSLVVTDGVFSMDGDLAPLRELASACARHDATLVVDDAHGLGVLGANGRGSLEHFGLRQTDVPVLVGTLGKAFGTFGAFVAGETDLIELLIQRARTYMYTTALPPAVAAATRVALEVAQAEPWRRERALAHAARFRDLAGEAGLPLGESFTPIQPVLLREARSATAASEALLEHGFLVTAIRPPTVPEGGSRLRVTFSAAHEEAEVEQLVDALLSVFKKLGTAPNSQGTAATSGRGRSPRETVPSCPSVPHDSSRIVLLHGWGLHGGLFAPLARTLADAGHDVTCLDLPGHGGRRFEPPFTNLDELAAAIAADLPPACTLIGWSLGGMVAAKLAADGHPSIQRLVLIATTPRFVASDGWAHGIAPEIVVEFAAELERDYEGLIRRFLSLQARGDDQASELLRQLRASVFARGKPDPAALAAALDILTQADLRGSMSRIRVPALILAGEYDRLTLPGAGAWLASHIPSAWYQEIKGAGHAPFLSHPREFLAALGEFLPSPVRVQARS